MLDQAGKAFDPILVKVFAGLLGVYPIGTLLILDTGEMGLVVDACEGDDRTRPRIIVLHSGGHRGLEKGKVVDLADRNGRTGAYKRNIVRSLHPSMYGLQAAEFIL